MFLTQFYDSSNLKNGFILTIQTNCEKIFVKIFSQNNICKIEIAKIWHLSTKLGSDLIKLSLTLE